MLRRTTTRPASATCRRRSGERRSWSRTAIPGR
jgi:hypothetical protein